ncbi:MAG: 50S ribosomal protein L5 [Nanoarchaeota archaeon]|nr:50S ribosomal protein L5 [Nanoarchaeota archaeon]
MNKMREIKVEKVTINIGTGEPGAKLDKAIKLLSQITGKKPVSTFTKGRTTFGSPKGKIIGCKVTLRNEDAMKFLKDALSVIETKLSKKCFDKQGNFSFGVKEHIDLPGLKYNPDIGIYGMDVCVTLERRGFRVKRKKNPAKIGANHLITAQDASGFAVKELGVRLE